jgi:hypothetical protein
MAVNKYRQTPVSADSVIRGLQRAENKNWKIKEINGSLVSKRAPSENGP